MRKLIAIAIFAVSAAAGWGYAQEMPPEIKEFLDNYTNDSTAENLGGPLLLKKYGHIPESVQIKELRLRAIQEYVFRHDINFDAYPDTVALSEVIVPTGRWRVALMAHNKVFCELTLEHRRKLRFTASTGPGADLSRHSLWGPLLKAYPESTGINPVVIGLSGVNFFPWSYDSFLYFKQLGPRKIYYCGVRKDLRPELDSLFSSPIEKLNDSKKLIKYKKELDIKRKEDRARLEKAKADGKEENVEQKKFFSHPAIYSNPGINTKPTITQKELEIDHKKLFSTVD